MKNGTLYGIGVGPGDPELITLKAINILRRVAVVFAAASTKNSHSLAEKIVSPHLKEGVPVVPLGFPMTRDKKMLAGAWRENARKVVETLKKEEDAAFITLGDPMIYSTFGYIMRTIKETDPDIPIEIVPGITSYQAGAAAAGQSLVEAEESYAVISGALGSQKLKDIIDHTDSVVMLKVYHNYKEILDTLNQLDLTAGSVLISRCGLDGEKILTDVKKLRDTDPPYLSLLIIKKNNKG
ncbi:MAG: precorrin-2 C(20)-methyltransferase [Deltaproteobacteria bacterium]|nr:precorrin-2 C(20)-methyltransferase [Deltaproteobacteria bacterium]